MNNILTLVVVIGFFIAFYKIQGAFLKYVLSFWTGLFVLYIMKAAMALTTAYMIYASIAVVGSTGRIRSIEDIFTILQARPSQVGGVGILGAIIGSVFGLYTFIHWPVLRNNSSVPQQGRPVQYETFTRRVTVVGGIRGFIQRNLKK